MKLIALAAAFALLCSPALAAPAPDPRDAQIAQLKAQLQALAAETHALQVTIAAVQKQRNDGADQLALISVKEELAAEAAAAAKAAAKPEPKP